MERNRKLHVSIVSTTLGLFIIQLGFFYGLGRVFEFPSDLYFFFGSLSLAYHGLLFFVLFLFRFAFYNVGTGAPLSSSNLPTKLTMVRISSTPTIIILLVIHQEYPVLP